MTVKKTLISFFACLLFTTNYAQQSTPVKEKKLSVNEQTQVEKAQYFYEQKNYRLALHTFEKILATHPNDNMVKYFTALCYATLPDKHPLMLQYLTEVYAANKKAAKIEYELARAYFFNYKFDEASDYLKQYSSKLKKPNKDQQKEIDQLSRTIKNAKALVANPLNVKITNLGNVINTTAIEYSPYVDMNDSLLVYTYSGELSTGGLQNAFNEPDKNGLYYEDVFTSSKVNEVWTTPKGIASLNTVNNDAALSISYDGKMLLISRDSSNDDGDIYMSRLIDNQWGTAVKLRGDVNTAAWEDNGCLSPDGKTLYFSSNRPGGYGGKDLYKATLLPDSSWGTAHNLGDKINTAEDEDDPFIHLDGKLFLFSSKGHNSMGGYDIFKTYLNLVDSSWFDPENIGYPINTTDDDIHYSLSPGGDKGYYAISKPDGFGDNDLYMVEPGITGIMPTMLVVKGTVSLNNLPTESTIEVLVNNSSYKKYKSNPVSGFYQIVLPLGQDYKIVWRSDTAVQTETVEATNAKEYILKIKDVRFRNKPDTAAVANVGLINIVGKLVGKDKKPLKNINLYLLYFNKKDITDTSVIDTAGIFRFNKLPADGNCVLNISENDAKLNHLHKVYLTDLKGKIIGEFVKDRLKGYSFNLLASDKSMLNDLNTDDSSIIKGNKGGTATGNEIVEGLSYKIQVAAYCLNEDVIYKKVKRFGKIEKIVVDNHTRFMLKKEYQTLNQVNEALEQVRKIAVPDAFVICNYKGKRCYLYELWKQGIIPEEKK
ncbi:MAG: hypothetical protein ACYDCN_03185 [Bacteroidia bacterium]